MGRASTFSDQGIFAAVSAQIALGGAFRIQGIVDDTGVSIGSLYHRYGSREGIMAAAWLNALQAFQHVFLKALNSAHGDAGERAALATPQFSRAQRDQAIILCVGRHETLMNENAPQAVRQEVDQLNDEMRQALMAYAKRERLDLHACLHGMVAFPLASVRLYLPRKKVPKSVDDFVRAAYRSVIRL